MFAILSSILPIVAALAIGYACGRVLPPHWRAALSRLLTPLVWLLLFLIGSEFGEVIASAQALTQVLKVATVIALLTTLLPCLLLIVSGTGTFSRERPDSGSFNLQALWHPLKDCSIALGMVALGVLLFILSQQWLGQQLPLPSSGWFLLLLVALVGIDLTGVRINRSWFSLTVLSVPVLVVIGSLLGALVAAWITGENLKTALALSSGFGWMTLSSVLVGNTLGQFYGTMALMTDLMRELLGVILLYAIGRYHPKASIGSAAATAMDSTLPIVKQNCVAEAVPMALVSGFVLTLLAPLMISLFLA